MTDIKETPSSVNTFTPILDTDSRGAFVRLSPTRNLRIHDTLFSRWYLRSRFTQLNATDSGRAWFALKTLPPMLETTWMNKPPREYQKIGLQRMRVDAMSLFFDMGLGKTFMFLHYCLALFEQQNKNYFLVVCPNNLFIEWKAQILEHVKTPELIQTYVLHGTKRAEASAALRTADPRRPIFIFTSYHTLKNVAEMLATLPITVWGCDESQNIRYMSTAITKVAHKLASKIPNSYRIPLSGTPSSTKVSGYFSLYEFAKPGCTGFSSEFMFNKHFEKQLQFLVTNIDGKERHVFYEKKDDWIEKNKPGFSWALQVHDPESELPILRVYHKPVGVQNFDQLQQMTERWAYARKKEEVLPDLPEKTYIQKMIPLSAAQRKAYQDVLANSRTEIESTVFSFSNMSSPHSKLHQIANGYLKNSDGTIYWFDEQPKIEALDSFLNDAENEKVLIWVPFIPLLEKIVARIRERGEPVVTLHGSMTQRERDESVTTFKTSEEPVRWVGNPAAGGVGYNLAMSCVQLFYTNWHRPDQRNQAEDRQHRLGQTRGVMIYDFTSEGTLEIKLLNSLRKATNLEDRILTIRDLRGEIG